MATATWQENIQAAMNNTAALLEEITRNPKPTYNVHGHNYKWAEYQKMLQESMFQYAKLLAQGSPFEEIGIGV